MLALPHEVESRRISRWHFELRRQPEGLTLRPVSDQITEVDGVLVARGNEVTIHPGTVVCVGRVLTLEFFSRPVPQTLETSDAISTAQP